MQGLGRCFHTKLEGSLFFPGKPGSRQQHLGHRVECGHRVDSPKQPARGRGAGGVGACDSQRGPDGPYLGVRFELGGRRKLHCESDIPHRDGRAHSSVGIDCACGVSASSQRQ